MNVIVNLTRSRVALSVAAIAATGLISSCGFKSDLFIPGEPQKLEQLDRETLENMDQETRDKLTEQYLEGLELPQSKPVSDQVAEELPGVPVEITPLTPAEIKKLNDKKNNQ